MNGYEAYGWQEDAYLAANPEVRRAVEQGVVPDGYHHYMLMGRFEGRRGAVLAQAPAAETRLCLDPWTNAEFTVDGELKPCCNFREGVALDDDAGVRRSHEAPLFRDLRHELLTGNLRPECARCHIRAKVPAQELVRQLYPQLPPGGNLLGPGRLEAIRIDLTHKCNLRCVYCALSVAGASGGRHMTEQDMARVARFVGEIGPVRTVGVNGHGETTHHPGWKAFCDDLIARGAPLSIITNLGRAYDEGEIVTLSRFAVIQISLDLADEALLKRIRRKVELPRIVANIAAIRARAVLDGTRTPFFAFSCGLYDKSIVRLESFAALAAALGIRSITFWDLMKYPDLPGAENVQPLSSLDDEALAHALDCYDRAIAIFARNRIRTAVAGEFIEPLRARLGQPAGSVVP